MYPTTVRPLFKLFLFGEEILLKKDNTSTLSMTDEKLFMVKFVVKNGKMATKMTSKNMTPQESLGLLDIAKQQILDGLKDNKKEIFKGYKDD